MEKIDRQVSSDKSAPDKSCSESSLTHLAQIIAEIESGKSVLIEHELIEPEND